MCHQVFLRSAAKKHVSITYRLPSGSSKQGPAINCRGAELLSAIPQL
jgi:hypothetical protein